MMKLEVKFNGNNYMDLGKVRNGQEIANGDQGFPSKEAE